MKKTNDLSEYKKSLDLVSSLEGQRSITNKYENWLISAIAFTWSLFQLYIAVYPINSTITRSIHLSFAMALVFLIYPFAKKKISFLDNILFKYLIMLLGVFTACYIAVFYRDLSFRPGDYTIVDITVALLGIVVLLEAGRRVLGIALSIVAIVFILYDLFGPYMPELIMHKGASLNKLAGHMFLTTEGIFGVPLGVSSSFVFLFVLFGALLDKAGAGAYFINLAVSILGKYKGGPAKAAVFASGFTGIMSGSSIANTVTTGTFTIPLMKKTGFSPEKAAAVEVAASTNGQLMPPVMGAAAFIIAEFLGLSYMDVIYAAFIPAFVSYLALFFIVHLEASKLGLKGLTKKELPPRWKTFISGIHFIFPVLFLLYTLMVLRKSTATAAFNAVILLIILMFFQYPVKKIITRQKILLNDWLDGLRDIFAGLISGARNMVAIAIATGIAGIIVGSITLTGIGQVLLEVIEAFSNDSVILMLILTAFVSLILGMGLPTTANYIVVSSLTAPVILMLAWQNGYFIPSIAAHLFVFYFGILADDTPPVGLAAYAASGIAKSDPIKTGIQGFKYDIRTAILPFMFFFNSELLLIANVNHSNPSDASQWVWINNPLEVIIIFVTAVIGMLSFSCFTQNYFIIKANIIEKIGFIIITMLMFLPKLVQNYLGMLSHYFSYLMGIGVFSIIFFMQNFRKSKLIKN